MCAIKPRFKKRIIFDFYTADPNMTEVQFNVGVIEWSLKQEQHCNTYSPNIRLHIKETDQQAD